uniref:ShTK domain protein n=1 Tax=Caenorhabditis tropicalis TaxID=1561998 RepID=A0A1I7T7K1_9PELO
MNFQILILVSSVFLVDGAVNLGCTSAPQPSVMGQCPDGYTMITAGGCCPDADVYIIGATTTPAPTTATTTTASSSTCQDKLNPNTGVSDCPGLKGYCQNPAYVKIMKDQCPKTCGYCSTTASTCQDKINPQTGVSDCPGMINYCQNPVYHDVMKDQCPKTCGYC